MADNSTIDDALLDDAIARLRETFEARNARAASALQLFISMFLPCCVTLCGLLRLVGFCQADSDPTLPLHLPQIAVSGKFEADVAIARPPDLYLREC